MRTNRKALYFFTGLAIFFGFFIIVLFHFVEMNHIQQSAISVLNQAQNQEDYTTAGTLPDVYVIHTEDLPANTLPDPEKRMVAYYLKNRDTMPFGAVQKFQQGDSCFYFIPLKDLDTDLSKYAPGSGTPLIYVNLSFESDLIRTTTLILSAAMAAIAAILYFAGEYIAKILDDKERSMKCFFANASHELKTPLMAIRGYADGVANSIVPAEKGCEIIAKETERMGTLVEDILKISKLDSGAATPQMAMNDLREILYDAILAIEPTASQNGTELVLNLPTPLMAECDEEMIFSAVSNILTNSVRYAKSAIWIEADKDTGIIRIQLSDDGTGFSAYDEQHAFDRFYKGAQGQSGIGLALAREYIRLHGGDITLSRTDKTTFCITLPVRNKRKQRKKD